VSDEGYAGVFDELQGRVGLDALKAFHLNDSKTRAGSRVDRHQEIGDGTLGLLPFWRLVNDRRFAALPGILESHPARTSSPRSRATSAARALIGAPRPEVDATVRTAARPAADPVRPRRAASGADFVIKP
jgi:hypothetical protein